MSTVWQKVLGWMLKHNLAQKNALTQQQEKFHQVVSTKQGKNMKIEM